MGIASTGRVSLCSHALTACGPRKKSFCTGLSSQSFAASLALLCSGNSCSWVELLFAWYLSSLCSCTCPILHTTLSPLMKCMSTALGLSWELAKEAGARVIRLYFCFSLSYIIPFHSPPGFYFPSKFPLKLSLLFHQIFQIFLLLNTKIILSIK